MNEKEIEEAFRAYFANIYMSTEPEECDIEICIKSIELRVMEEMNSRLCMDYTKQEVEEA